MRVRGLVHDDDVDAVELVGDGVRHGQHPGREARDQESFDRERRVGLHHDLSAVPDVGAAGEERRSPPVPRVKRVGVHHVDVETAEQAGQADHGDRPRQRVPDPVAQPMTARDSAHRHDVDLHAGGLEVAAQRRLGGDDDMAFEFGAWQAADHP